MLRWMFIDVVTYLTGVAPEVGPGRPSVDVHGITFSYVRVTGLDRPELENACNVCSFCHL